MSRIRREGTLSQGETLSSDDPALKGKTARQKIRVIRKRVLEEGGLLSLRNTFAQAKWLAKERSTHGPLARNSARSLWESVTLVRRELLRVRKLHGAKSRELEQLSLFAWRSIALGFTLAYFRVDRADDLVQDRRKKGSRASYYAAKKLARNRTELMYVLGFKTLHGLRKFEKQNGVERSTVTK